MTTDWNEREMVYELGEKMRDPTDQRPNGDSIRPRSALAVGNAPPFIVGW
jgi:hypothetical protein